MNLLQKRANADLSPAKIDLGPGVYRGIDGSKPYILSAIKRVSQFVTLFHQQIHFLIQFQAKVILSENDPGHEVRAPPPRESRNEISQHESIN